jgi:hypothetical protein
MEGDMRKKKGEWEQAKQTFLNISERPKTYEERETVPEISCGNCKNFVASSRLGSSGGICTVLKAGSDITSDPPVFVLEGEANLQSDVMMDASKCTHHEPLGLVDTDITEAFDGRYSRHQRQRMQ